MSATIRRVTAQELPQHLHSLNELLRDAVDTGASVGFLPPLPQQEGAAYWQEVGAAVNTGNTLLLVAEEAGQVVGTV